MSKLNLGLLKLEDLVIAAGLFIKEIEHQQKRKAEVESRIDGKNWAVLLQELIDERRENLERFIVTVDEINSSLAASLRDELAKIGK